MPTPPHSVPTPPTRQRPSTTAPAAPRQSRTEPRRARPACTRNFFLQAFPNCRSQTGSPQHPASRSRRQRRDGATEIMAQARIGVTLKERGRYFEFSALDKNLPAYKAGARKGDVLMYVEVSTFPDCASRRQHALAPAHPVLFRVYAFSAVPVACSRLLVLASSGDYVTNETLGARTFASWTGRAPT
jgi:hypothetical protein